MPLCPPPPQLHLLVLLLPCCFLFGRGVRRAAAPYGMVVLREPASTATADNTLQGLSVNTRSSSSLVGSRCVLQKTPQYPGEGLCFETRGEMSFVPAGGHFEMRKSPNPTKTTTKLMHLHAWKLAYGRCSGCLDTPLIAKLIVDGRTLHKYSLDILNPRSSVMSLRSCSDAEFDHANKIEDWRIEALAGDYLGGRSSCITLLAVGAW